MLHEIPTSRTYSNFMGSNGNIVPIVNDRDFYIVYAYVSGQPHDPSATYELLMYEGDDAATDKRLLLAGTSVLSNGNSEIIFNSPSAPLRVSAGQPLSVHERIATGYSTTEVVTWIINGFYK